MTSPRGSSDAVEPVDPYLVAEYLRFHRWHERDTNGRYFLFTNEVDSGDAFEVTLPVDVRYRDYNRRLHEALDTLEAAEENAPTGWNRLCGRRSTKF